ncbi:hypothetical protein [Paenibacillus alvei]|uniref:hypothetical protein n=1 Tax=Paenibacillus alvei TaxID=44250 RepID=UPI003D303419
MSELFSGGEGRSAKGLIFRSLLQWDSSDCMRDLKVRIPLQRRTLPLLQIQPLRSAAAHRKVTLFPNTQKLYT